MTVALAAVTATMVTVICLDGSAKQMNEGRPNRSTYLGGTSSFQKTADTLTNTSKK